MPTAIHDRTLDQRHETEAQTPAQALIDLFRLCRLSWVDEPGTAQVRTVLIEAVETTEPLLAVWEIIVTASYDGCAQPYQLQVYGRVAELREPA